MFNDALTESLAADQARDAHIECIECQADGCTGCPGAFCELPRLVEHCNEWMCPGCIARFDAHVTNRCTGDVCNCDACPELVDDTEETTPLPVPAEPMRSVVFGRLALVAGLLLALALGSQGCAAHAPAPEVEAVGTLAAGPSVYSQPVRHDAPPELGTIVDTGSDDVSAEVSTTTRTADAGEQDAAPEVVGKGGGLLVGGAR